MISIIVSTYKPEAFSAFEKSVAETIGVKYEIVKINNPGKMGLCEAYNLGIENAKYSYLCFSHDDIIFHTNNWGKILIDTFERDPKLGLVGIAGSSYKSWMPSGWAAPQISRFPKMNFLQKINGRSNLMYNNPNSEKFSEVISLDGCWFCTKREVTDNYKFDENLLKKYHCYDLDYCLNVSQQYKIGVTFEILLEHLSQGSYDRSWVEESVKVHKKWSTVLPKTCQLITSEEQFNQEMISFVEWIKTRKINGYTNKNELASLYFSKKFYSQLGFLDWVLFPIQICIDYILKRLTKTVHSK